MCGTQLAHADAYGFENGALKKTLVDRLEQGPLLELIAAQLRSVTLLPWQAEARHSFQTFGIEQHLQTAIDQLRAIIVDLSGEAMAAEESLSMRLTTLCEQFHESTGIECRLLALPAHLRFTAPVDEVLFRALRELLANVRQHARATSVCITSSEQTSSIAITVRDNGIGTPDDAQRRKAGGGLGPWTIGQRLTEFGVTLDVGVDTGTFATIYLPRALLVAD